MNEACGQGHKTRYVATNRLQLVSLGFSRACRAFTTFNVRLDMGLPRTILAVGGLLGHPTPNDREPPSLSRVPALRMLSATWDITFTEPWRQASGEEIPADARRQLSYKKVFLHGR